MNKLKTDYPSDLKLWQVYHFSMTFPFMLTEFTTKRFNVILII